MKQNKTSRFMCYIWLLVPLLSLLRLSQPMITVQIDDTVVFSAVAEPVKSYNAFQLLIHRNLVNAYNDIVIDRKNPGLLMLKIMITLQLVCDVAVVCICLQEWREKQNPKIFLRLKGILSMGYVLMAIAIYRFSQVCVNHPKASVVVASYAKYDQYELEKNIYFSIAIVVLFLVTWSFFRMEKAYRRMCYFWIIVPVLSLAILSRPMIVIQTDDIYPITDMNYNGFQVLAYGSLTNEYKDIVIDRGNLGFVMIKIMIALQLIFDVVLVIIALWEWRKKRNPKYFLCLRGGLTVGYVLTSVIIYRITEWWFDNLEIEHALGAFLMRTSYAFGEWGVYMTLIFSIAIAILFVVSLLAFCLTPKKKGSKMKRNKIYRLLYFLWFFVPVLSLVRLSQPMLGIEIGGECAPGSDPVKLYNGFQLLVCRYLRNGYNHIVTDMSNPGFDILKIMIALQLVCDVILISICLREWREKQTSERFLRLRGMLSMGYVLTAFLFYQFIPVCDNHLKVDLFESFISYIQYEYIFSFGVVVLFIITWLFFCKEKAIKIRREKVPEQKG